VKTAGNNEQESPVRFDETQRAFCSHIVLCSRRDRPQRQPIIKDEKFAINVCVRGPAPLDCKLRRRIVDGAFSTVPGVGAVRTRNSCGVEFVVYGTSLPIFIVRDEAEFVGPLRSPPSSVSSPQTDRSSWTPIAASSSPPRPWSSSERSQTGRPITRPRGDIAGFVPR